MKDKVQITTTSHPELRFSNIRGHTFSEFDNLSIGADLTYTYDGQGAIFQLLSHLKKGGRHYVVVPAFHCPTVVEPIVKNGLTPRYYRVRRDLSIDTNDFLSCLGDDVAAAIIINYFGFPTKIERLRDECQQNRTPLIEDCAHSFLTDEPLTLSGGRADYAIYSFKKIVPSYVGGAIRNNSAEFTVRPSPAAAPFRKSLKNVKRMLDQAVTQSNSTVLNQIQNRVDSTYQLIKSFGNSARMKSDDRELAPTNNYPFDMGLSKSRIPWYALHILRAAPLRNIVNIRQRNFNLLRGNLSSIRQLELVKESEIASICPWALPIVVSQRSPLDRLLKSKGVPLFTFGETLHSSLSARSVVGKKTLTDAEYLSSHLLCLSIHQNVPRPYINSMSHVILDTIGRLNVRFKNEIGS